MIGRVRLGKRLFLVTASTELVEAMSKCCGLSARGLLLQPGGPLQGDVIVIGERAEAEHFGPPRAAGAR